MSEYTEYVVGVYVLALVVYGGVSLLWSRRLRHYQDRLDDMQELGK